MGMARHVVRGSLFAALLAAGGACSSSEPHSASGPDPLTYEYTTYLPGLEQRARIVKTLRSVEVYLDDGRVVSGPQMMALDADARRAKFGAMDPGFAKYVRTQPPDAILKVAFMFAIAPTESAPFYGTYPGASAAKVRLDALKQSIARGYANVKPMLLANGVKIETIVETMPVVLGEASAAVVDKLSRSPLITLAVTAEPRKACFTLADSRGRE